MKIGGFQKQSLIDFPGHISAVVFTQGCNFRCSYCHNSALVLPEKFLAPLNEQEIMDYIQHYKNLLDAICISGGEPTLQKDLPEFIRKVSKLGLKIKLDTNGSNPQMLKALLNEGLFDFVAMDIKHLLNTESYSSIVGFSVSNDLLDRVKESVELVQNSGIDYEFRTTQISPFHKDKDINFLRSQFGRNYKVQYFNFSEHILKPELYQ